MNLMDSLLDEFHDEATFKELNEREIAAWLEVVFLLRWYLLVGDILQIML